MKRLTIALAATIGLSLPVMADPTAPAPSPATAAPLADAKTPADVKTPAATGAPEKLKELRQACREQLKDKGLKGEARMKAVSDCVVKQRPDLAQREQCRLDGFDKGLRKDDLKSFVKDCVKGKG